jgi:hypothetical protein
MDGEGNESRIGRKRPGAGRKPASANRSTREIADALLPSDLDPDIDPVFADLGPSDLTGLT